MLHINHISKDVLVYTCPWLKLNQWMYTRYTCKIITLSSLWKHSSINIANVIRCKKCICLIDNISSLRTNLSPVKLRQQLISQSLF